jgi:hypothetical protein
MPQQSCRLFVTEVFSVFGHRTPQLSVIYLNHPLGEVLGDRPHFAGIGPDRPAVLVTAE